MATDTEANTMQTATDRSRARRAPESVLALSPDAHRLVGRVAFVTGAGRGAGRAHARLLASRGAAVAVVDIDEDVARGVVAEIKQAGGCATAIGVDITRRADAERAVVQAAEALGGLDILVHNAGLMYSMTGLEQTDEEDFNRLLAVNVHGPMYLTRAALPHLRRSRAPRVIFINSQWGQVPDGHSYGYMVAKAAQLGLMKTMAKEFTGDGILVNAITPGATLTRLVPEQYVEAEQRNIPLGRLAHPEDIAFAVAFLASDESAFIAGQTLAVNGGALVVGI
jgi:3-oxoacyl-[acyl-carrier protein] reductase